MNGADYRWAEQYMPLVGSILAEHFHTPQVLRRGTPAEDMQQGTDLVLESATGTFGVRIRRDLGFRDLTLRSVVASGARTEYQKWEAGEAPRYYFIGWAAQAGLAFNDWAILDCGTICSAPGLLAGADRSIRPNMDGTDYRVLPLIRLSLAGAVLVRAPWPGADPDRLPPPVAPAPTLFGRDVP